MQYEMTLWLDKRSPSAPALIRFFESLKLPVSIQYVEDRMVPVLFTRLGSFEGESEIRRAASSVLRAGEAV